MTIDALNAANAYRNQLKMMQDAPADTGEAPAQGTGQSSFMDMLSDAVQDAVNTQSQSEAKQLHSLSGAGTVSDLVTAVANAELSLNTVVAVRDRVINAYNDIIKMSI